MSTYDTVADLPLVVDGYALDGLERVVSSDFTRRTTLVSLHGRGETGVGEDVTYGADEHERLQRAGAVHDLAGAHTLESLSELIGSLDLFPDAAPSVDGWRHYRRWAFESAALDLALRQAGSSLAETLGIEPRPVSFVVSLRLGEPPAIERVLDLLSAYPGTRFKLDPTSDWDEALVGRLAALGAVDTVDLKGAYRGTIVDQPADSALYRLVAEGFSAAWIEDPDLSSPEADAVLEPHRSRITWDAIIHSVADIEALPFACGIVATDCPSGPREILEGGQWGRLVPCGQPAALADAINAEIGARRARPHDAWLRYEVNYAVERYIALITALAGSAREPNADALHATSR